MFRPLSKHFPDRSSGDSSDAGREARRKLNRALLFGALLLGIFLLSPFLLSDPQPPVNAEEHSPEKSTTEPSAAGRTPAPADPSPIDLGSPGVIVAVLLLAGGIGLALYLRNGNDPRAPQNNLFFPVAEYRIAPQQKLQLVYCAEEFLLLAVTPDRIHLLKTYPPDVLSVDGGPPTPANGSFEPPSGGFNGAPFAEVLRTYASQYTTRQ